MTRLTVYGQLERPSYLEALREQAAGFVERRSIVSPRAVSHRNEEIKMCCFMSILLFLGPRFGIIVWWLANPTRWDRLFSTFFWPLLGFFFVPWTTLMYVAVGLGGVHGFDWIWIGLAFVADLVSYGGSGYGNRERGTQYLSRA